MNKINQLPIVFFFLFLGYSNPLIDSKKCNFKEGKRNSIDNTIHNATNKGKEWQNLGSLQFYHKAWHGYISRNSQIATLDLGSLDGGRFFIHSQNWGSKVTNQIAKHMIGVDVAAMYTIQIKVDEMRTSLMHEHREKSFVDPEIFLAQITNYFPHSFANYESSYEQWTVNGGKNCGWFTPCSDNHHTQTKELAGYGEITIFLELEEQESEKNNNLNSTTSQKEDKINSTAKLSNTLKYYKINLLIKHFVRNNENKIVEKITNNKQKSLKIEIGRGYK